MLFVAQKCGVRHRTPHSSALKFLAHQCDNEKLVAGSGLARMTAEYARFVTLLDTVHRATTGERAVITLRAARVIGAVLRAATAVVASTARLATDVSKAVAVGVRVLGAVRVATTRLHPTPMFLHLRQSGSGKICRNRCASHGAGNSLHRLTAVKPLVRQGLRDLIEPVCHCHLLVFVPCQSQLTAEKHKPCDLNPPQIGATGTTLQQASLLDRRGKEERLPPLNSARPQANPFTMAYPGSVQRSTAALREHHSLIKMQAASNAGLQEWSRNYRSEFDPDIQIISVEDKF